MYLTPPNKFGKNIRRERFAISHKQKLNTRILDMMSSSFFASSTSILNIPNSKTPSLVIPSPKISSLDNPFPKINVPRRKCRTFDISLQQVKSSADSAMIVEDNMPAETSSNSPGIYDEEDEKAAEAQRKLGARVRVKVPLKVYHVPKFPEFELTGKVGTLKQYVGVHQGKKISANLPYKVEFVVDKVEGRKGSLKFFVHLKEDEFEYLD